MKPVCAVLSPDARSELREAGHKSLDTSKCLWCNDALYLNVELDTQMFTSAGHICMVFDAKESFQTSLALHLCIADYMADLL